MNEEPNFWTYVASFMTWVTGEAGKASIAGAAGGLVRWFHEEKRRVVEGIGTVFVGVISANYLPPLVVALLGLIGIHVEMTAATAGSTHFLSGLVGMSATKILIAIFEVTLPAKLRQIIGRGSDDQS